MENMKTLSLNLIENKIVKVDAEAVELFRSEDLEIIPALNVLAYFEEIQDGEEIEITKEYCNGEFTINGKEYRIYKDYDQAEADAVEYAEEIIEECGISENLMDIAIIQNMLDLDWFMEAAKESAECLAYEEGIEYIADNEELEALEAGEIKEDTIRENYYNSLIPSSNESAFDEFINNFGREYTEEIIINNGLLNTRELAQYCVDVDGVGHYLSSYDGEELNHYGSDYYLYRTN